MLKLNKVFWLPLLSPKAGQGITAAGPLLILTGFPFFPDDPENPGRGELNINCRRTVQPNSGC